MLNALSVAREPCRFYKAGYCRKGLKCTKVHKVGSIDNSTMLPFVSRCRTESGTDMLMLNPPLQTAIEKYFASKQKPVVLRECVQWKIDDVAVITFEAEHMAPPDKEACEATRVATFAYKKDKSRADKCEKQWPLCIAHGTTLIKSLSIAVHGCCVTTPGVAGEGVYGFACADSLDKEALTIAWKRTAIGGYNHAALWVLRTVPGILVNGHSSMIVPHGCIAVVRDQYAAAPGTVKYETLTVSVDGIVDCLQKELTSKRVQPSVAQGPQTHSGFNLLPVVASRSSDATSHNM